MKDLSLMKRITDIRDDLIENAYIPTAVALPMPTPPHGAMPGRFAVAAAACIVCLGVIVGLGIPAYRNWIEPALSGTDTEAEESSEPAEEGTEMDSADNAEKIRLSVEVIPEVVKPGETVEIRITIVECHVEMVALLNPILTYGSPHVTSEVFSYTTQYMNHDQTPFAFTLSIPENAPAGAYDLSIECAGLGTAVTFEKVLTVTERDDAKDNTHLWISTENGTVSPLLWIYASREVYVTDDPSAYEFWGYSYADGIGYMDYPSANLDKLPTVVWSEDLIFYDEGEVSENPVITVYDLTGNVIASAKRARIADVLESGIYYFCISDSYYGADHFEEALEVAKSIAEAYGEDVTEMQNLISAELDKDPYAFTDKYYCEHVFRVIIP